MPCGPVKKMGIRRTLGLGACMDKPEAVTA